MYEMPKRTAPNKIVLNQTVWSLHDQTALF